MIGLTLRTFAVRNIPVHMVQSGQWKVKYSDLKSLYNAARKDVREQCKRFDRISTTFSQLVQSSAVHCIDASAMAMSKEKVGRNTPDPLNLPIKVARRLLRSMMEND